MNNPQVTLIINISHVSDQIKEIIISELTQYNVSYTHLETVFDDVIKELIHRYHSDDNQTPPDYNRLSPNDIVELVYMNRGAMIMDLLRSSLVSSLTRDKCKIKCMVTYQEIIIVKTLTRGI